MTLKIPHGGPWGPWVYTGDGKGIVGVLSWGSVLSTQKLLLLYNAFGAGSLSYVPER